MKDKNKNRNLAGGMTLLSLNGGFILFGVFATFGGYLLRKFSTLAGDKKLQRYTELFLIANITRIFVNFSFTFTENFLITYLGILLSVSVLVFTLLILQKLVIYLSLKLKEKDHVEMIRKNNIGFSTIITIDTSVVIFMFLTVYVNIFPNIFLSDFVTFFISPKISVITIGVLTFIKLRMSKVFTKSISILSYNR